VVIASGHSAAGDYRQARRAILFADSPFTDALASAPDRGLSARQTVEGLRTRTAGGAYDTEVLPDSVPRGSQIIERAGRPVGFVSDKLYVFPAASADEAADAAWLHRLHLDAANRWKLPAAAPLTDAGNVFRSDTGELTLDRQRGLFTAVAPNVVIATGFLGKAETLTLGPVTISCKTPFASISLISLDGKPLDQSGRLLLTAVARAENTGQAFLGGAAARPSAEPRAIDADTGGLLVGRQLSLAQPGRAPVLSEPVHAQVTLATSQPLQAFALTPSGERREAIAVSRTGQAVVVETKDARSPWVVLAIQR
jgi:hypothetical protein